MQLLTDGCEKLGIQLTEKQKQQFHRYYQLLMEWNRHVNLTSVTEYADVMVKHFLDSLCMVKLMDMHTAGNVMDVGSGAGFPGIPLKIIFPDMQLTLLDSLNKRIQFLEALQDELGLEGVLAIHGRAEDMGRDRKYREKFDLCISRAVAKLPVLSEYCIPLVCVGGSFVAYKSGKVQAELESSQEAIRRLGGSLGEEKRFTVPESDMERTLIQIKKIRKTPGKYPRKSGMPGKMPLGSKKL